MRSWRLILCGLAVSLLWPCVGFAQNVSNPTAVDFDASADHAAMSQSTPSVPLLSSYAIEIYASTGTLVKSTDVGKPAPVSGKILIDLMPIRQTVPLGTGYTIKAVAKGPGGATSSAASVPFDWTIPAPRAPGVPVPKLQ